MGVNLKLPIGSCSVQLSREAVIYDDKTKKALTAALKGAYAEIKILAKDMLSNETSLWNAMTKLAEISRGNSRLGSIVRKEARYNGEEVNPFFEPADKAPFGWIKSRDRKGNAYGKCPNFPFSSGPLEVGRVACIIVNDLYGDTKARSTARIKKYVEDNLNIGDQVLVIQKLEDLPKFGDPSPDQYVLVSTMPLPPTQRGNYAKAKFRAFRLPEDRWKLPGYGETWRKYLVEISPEWLPSYGLFSEMDNYSIDPVVLAGVNRGVLDRNEIILVNKTSASQLDKSKFKPAAKEYIKRKDAMIAQYEDLGVYRTLKFHPNRTLHNLFQMFGTSNLSDLFKGYETKRKPLAKLYRLYLKYYLPNASAKGFLIDDVEAKPVPRINLEALIDDYLETQPEVEALRIAISQVSNPDAIVTLKNIFTEKM